MNRPGEQQLGMRVTMILALAACAWVGDRSATGEVVIDMPPPPRATTRNENADESVDDAQSDRDSEAPSDDSDDSPDEANAKPDARERPDSHGRARYAGSLALARYSGARTIARPSVPVDALGYQPRSRGIGPWGLGHPPEWYLGNWAVAPTIYHDRRFGALTLPTVRGWW